MYVQTNKANENIDNHTIIQIMQEQNIYINISALNKTKTYINTYASKYMH